ncbi:LruC domain-containing protein [Lutibacter holmesii]|uniref:LruC domain-containing protein n=1 Tax=Lutibacter holmesii TaxID=1137985 RepID=A0ABW3WRR6_9FLAO
MKSLNLYVLLSFLVIYISCTPNSDEIEEPETEIIVETSKQILENLSIPSDFNFETERNVTLTINDATPYVKYEIFAYSTNYSSEEENISEALNNLLYSGKPSNGSIVHVFSLSTVYNKVYISRKDGLEYSSEIIDIINNEIDFNISNSSKSSRKTNESYKTNDNGCVECEDNFFLNGDFENGPSLPKTFIITSENNVEGWSTTATDSKIELWNSGFNGVPAQNGTYFAELNANKNAALYQRICTSPGAEISWSVWHRGRAGTDKAVVRIGENLATATTEVTMITDNTAWKKYSGTYKVPEGQIDTYFLFEAVSTAGSISVGNFIDNVVITETVAGDCTEVVNKIFYPTKFAVSTIAFEDLWPYSGDYDFNDLIISYNIETFLNAQNKVTQVDFNYKVESIGAGYTNGFGVELEGVSPSLISSVTGMNLTEGIITNNSNGTEQNQPNAVIIFFDNAQENENLFNTISVIFSEPITTETLGTAPFNPFLIVNKDRLTEIHLPNKPTTYFPTTTTIDDLPTVKDADGNFKTPEGLPWAINVTGDFSAPKESTVITDAYNYFADWATTGGSTYSDWYQDKSGYRNNKNLKN